MVKETNSQSVGIDLEKNKYHFYLSHITSPEEVNLPKDIPVGDIDLSGISSAEGLELPVDMEGSLNLNGLLSAKGLVLSKNIGGFLLLKSLTSVEWLVPPEFVGDFILLDGLTSTGGLEEFLKKTYVSVCLPGKLKESLSEGLLTIRSILFYPET